MENLTVPVTQAKEADLVQAASELGPLIGQHISDEETSGRLSAPVVNALKKAGFYKLFLPKSLGGIEADPVTTAKVVEEVARHNTAAGWSLMVANTTIFVGGHVSEQGIEEIFGNNPEAFIAGSIYPPLRAVQTKGGYIINGRNPLISNAHEADWIFATALVMEGDQLKITNGHPEFLGIIMKAGNCKIIDTWQVIGMKATDSNDIEAKDVLVPDHLAFPMGPVPPTGTHFQGPLYRFPAAGANIGCLLAPVALGVARNAIEELKALASKKTPLGSSVPMKDRGVVQRKLGRAEALVQSGRIFLHDRLAKCWNKTQAGKEVTMEDKAGLLLAATHANQSAVEAVELVYTAAGTNGIYTKNKLAHYFADAQVLRQHGFMNESRYETAAQMYFGMQPDLMLVAF